MNGVDLLGALKSATRTENFDNIPDSKYYKWLSYSHKQIAEYIKAKVDSKYFMGISQCNLVSGQYLYDNIGLNTSNGRSITIIDALYIKYNGSKFIKATPRDLTEMPESREYYLENQSASDPFYVISGQKFLVFPSPILDVVNGIEVIGSRDVADITSTTTEAEVFNGVLRDKHYEIVEGAKRYVYEFLQELDKANFSKREFEQVNLENLRAEVSYRGSQPVEYKERDFRDLTE